MNNIHYLDHAATSYPTKYFAKDYYIPGNPNSPHAMGLQANQALNEARQRIMDCLGVKSGKILFCRCATEAVEWLRRYFKGMDYVSCSFMEHDSVYDVCDSKVCSEEILSKGWVYSFPLYLHQFCNHITGTIFDIESIGKQVQSTGAFFGSDITAGLGKYPLPQNLDTFCDAVWFSGRKIHYETMGAIWLSDRLFKYLGGSEDIRNEFGLLHGTTNVPGAIALSYAVEHAVDEAWVMEAKTQNLVFHLQKMLDKNDIEYHVVCDDQPKTHAINAIYLPKFNADALVNFLSSKGIYISPGHSACSSNAADASRVLEAFGLTKEQASQTVRISFGENTSEADIDALVNGIMEFKNLFV